MRKHGVVHCHPFVNFWLPLPSSPPDSLPSRPPPENTLRYYYKNSIFTAVFLILFTFHEGGALRRQSTFPGSRPSPVYFPAMADIDYADNQIICSNFVNYTIASRPPGIISFKRSLELFSFMRIQSNRFQDIDKAKIKIFFLAIYFIKELSGRLRKLKLIFFQCGSGARQRALSCLASLLLLLSQTFS